MNSFDLTLNGHAAAPRNNHSVLMSRKQAAVYLGFAERASVADATNACGVPRIHVRLIHALSPLPVQSGLHSYYLVGNLTRRFFRQEMSTAIHGAVLHIFGHHTHHLAYFCT